MKKKYVKHLSDIAATLPVIMLHSVEYHYVTGAELLSDGIQDINGVPVLPAGRYKQAWPVQIAINHTTQLKKYFNLWGLDGVKKYVSEVNKKYKK